MSIHEIILGLECCRDFGPDKCYKCPYSHRELDCSEALFNDILLLLRSIL